MTEPFFIKLESPSELQIGVLSASKLLLQITKSQLHLQKIASSKKELKESLHTQLKNITDLVIKLQEQLPHADLLSEFKRVEEQAEQVIAKPISIETPKVEKIAIPKPSSDLDKLNDAILAIEAKIAALK